MDIRIADGDAREIWEVLGLKDEEPIEADDSCWMGDAVYALYGWDDITIRAVFAVRDPQAPMDSDEFADYSKPDYLAIVTSE